MRQSFGHVHSAALDLAEKRSVRRQWECALLLAGALAAASFAPHPIVLPIVSAVLVIGALLAAGFAWLRSERRTVGEFTRWDQAGVLIFAGFVAALTGDSAETLQLMETFAEVPPARE
jgi:hypothetical protein